MESFDCGGGDGNDERIESRKPERIKPLYIDNPNRDT
jgi:hypothetical protein